MRKIIVPLIILILVAFLATLFISSKPKTMTSIEDYSHKDFTNRNLSDRADMDGLTIVNSSFSQETPDSHVFPDTMTGTTFIDCNLDNVYVPAGNTVNGGSQRRFKAQPDGHDWLIDNNDNPLTPIN